MAESKPYLPHFAMPFMLDKRIAAAHYFEESRYSMPQTLTILLLVIERLLKKLTSKASFQSVYLDQGSCLGSCELNTPMTIIMHL